MKTETLVSFLPTVPCSASRLSPRGEIPLQITSTRGYTYKIEVLETAAGTAS